MPELRKIISINPGGDFGVSAAKEHLLWPCRAFTVTMPSRPRNTLNVIETCILRLTPFEAGNTVRIAAAMCVETELVAFVQDRLTAMGFLTDSHELTEIGRTLLDTSEESQSTGVFTVLKDCLTGRLIAHIHSGSFSYLEVVEDNGGRVKFLPDSQKKRRHINARSVFAESLKVSAPKPSDITKLLRRISRWELGRTRIPDAGAVVVNSESELVYLHCMAVLPETGGELIITDGLGRPSEKFRAALLGAKWLDDFRSGAVGSASKFRDESRDSERKPLQKVYDNLAKLTERIDSTTDIDANTDATAESLRELYGELERALSVVAVKGSVWGRVLGGGQASSNSNGGRFKKYAKKAGFVFDKSIAGLMAIPPGRFRGYENGGESEMWTLLALASAQAHDDTDHPINKIAHEDPGFLMFAADLKAKRDAVSHGESLSMNDPEQWRGIISRTENALRLLLPGIQLAEHEAEHIELDADARARAELEHIFGFEYICRIKDRGLFRQLLRVRMMLAGEADPDQCLEAVTCLASCLQILAEDHMREGSMYRPDMKTLQTDIAERIKACGFTFGDGEEFKSFLMTNSRRVLQAVRGKDSTLGADVSALLVLEDEDVLREFAGLCPEYVQVVGRLILLRGHGQVWEGRANLYELRELEGEVHKIIKIFEEEF